MKGKHKWVKKKKKMFLLSYRNSMSCGITRVMFPPEPNSVLTVPKPNVIQYTSQL